MGKYMTIYLAVKHDSSKAQLHRLSTIKVKNDTNRKREETN